MVIKEIIDDKMLYMDLLLLADEQENMIHRYLERHKGSNKSGFLEVKYGDQRNY